MNVGQLRALGIYSRLDQVFDAPDAVKEVMISQFGLEYSVCSSLPQQSVLNYEENKLGSRELVNFK